MSVGGPLADRVALVTGAGRGIGRAIATRMAKEGASVVVSARTASEIAAVSEQIRATGSDARAVVADASDRVAAREPVRFAIQQFGRIDILVNNVGGSAGPNRDPFSCTDEAFEETLALTLTSAWWATSEALSHMRAQQYGRIINIGSGSAKRSGEAIAYCAAKHGVIGLTRALAAALAPDGITVNCLCPGWTNTSNIDWVAIGRAKGVSSEEARVRAESESLQHRILEPEELGGMAVLLASADGAGITGQVLSVDGGYRV